MTNVTPRTGDVVYDFDRDGDGVGGHDRGCAFTRTKLRGQRKVSVPPESLLALGPHP